MFYSKSTSMKTFLRLFLLIAILAVSCTKQEVSYVSYDGTTWMGEYPTQTENGTTGELEEQTACIELIFQENAKVCSFYSGLKGLLAVNKINYDVNWSSSNSFSLSPSAGWRTIVSYAGEIYGDRMFLYFVSCDKVERTVVLQQYKFRYLND